MGEQNSLIAEEAMLPSYWVDNEALKSAWIPTAGWQKELHAFAGVLFATESGPPSEERLNWTVAQLSDLLASMTGMGGIVYRFSLFLVAWFSPLLVFRFPTFRRLSYERRQVALHRFEKTPMGLMIFALKALLCIVYYEHPEAAREVSFDGLGMLEERG